MRANVDRVIVWRVCVCVGTRILIKISSASRLCCGGGADCETINLYRVTRVHTLTLQCECASTSVCECVCVVVHGGGVRRVDLMFTCASAHAY